MINSVMLIDDNEIDQRLFRRVLDRSDKVGTTYSFTMATQALEFLKQADCPPIDLILLDINMPRMDGFEFLDALEAEFGEEMKALVIVMLTTSLSPHDRDRAANSGLVRDYFNKPLTMDHLELVERYIAASGELPRAAS